MVAVALVLLSSSTAMADDDEDKFRIVVTEVPGGGDDIVIDTLRNLDQTEVIDHAEFVEDVEERAFDPGTVLDSRSDLEWVMDGAKYDIIITFGDETEHDYRVDFITHEEATSEYDFLVDRGHDGSLRRGGATMLLYELEEFLEMRPEIVAEAIGQVGVVEEVEETEPEDDESGADPDELRRRAAEDREAFAEVMSREWLWVRAFGRYMRKDVSAAAPQAVYNYKSSLFPGGEIELEMFPMAPVNPDMATAGFYASYNHGTYGVSLVDEETDEITDELSVHNLTAEGGLVYRLDTPLEESNRQIRFRLGGRYDSFSIDENPEIPSTGMVSMVLGARLLLPVFVDEFAVTAGLDVSPLAVFTDGSDIFGEDSFSYGFGTELGLLYEIFDGGSLTAGYTFRMMHTDFEGTGEPLEDASDPLVFENSEFYDLSQGLRAGFIYQY